VNDRSRCLVIQTAFLGDVVLTTPLLSMTYTYDGALSTGSVWSGAIPGSVTRTFDNDFRVISHRVDGANPWQIYRSIYLPLARPALATLAIFTFMWSWNDFINPIIYLRDVQSFTLTAGLSLFQGQYVGKWPLLMAGALVSVIPMIILFVIAQRHFVRGIALTGIKG